MDDNKVGTLLPISSITSELLEAVALAQIADDEDRTPENPPKEWYHLVKVAKEAIEIETNGFRSLLITYKETIEQNGADQTGGQVVKLLAMGWKMAEMALQREISKGVQ